MRLGRDPYEALGLVGSPTSLDVRNAFLTLTKTFHPQKFARMAPDIQRLANEVFLALRAAHDSLSRANRKSGPLPTIAATRGTQQTAAVQPSRVPTGQLPAVTRPPATPAPSPSGQPTQPARPFANPRPGPRPSPAPTPAASSQPARPAPPVAGSSSPAATAGGVDREVAPILELFKLGQVPAARVALETLVARAPNVPRYQALLHYARGREAQLAKRVDEARVELQDALQIDPDLALAKSALAELFTRRK